MKRPLVGQSAGDFDYTTDQSARIARRMAHGVYRITHAGQEVGEEAWTLLALLNGGYRVMTEIDLQWPTRNEQRVQLDVDDRWNILGLWAQIDISGVRRVAAYIPSGNRLNVELTDLAISDEDQRSGKWRLRSDVNALNPIPPRLSASPIMAPRRKVVQHQLIFEPGTHIDFASAMFNYVVLKRLGLTPGTAAPFSSVVVTLPSLEPLNIRQTYRYDADEPPGPDITQAPLRRHIITETGSPDMLTTFWCDQRDIVQKQELMLNGALHGCEIVSYRWQQ